MVVTVALLLRRRRDWLAGRGLGDVRADRQPGVAGAVVSGVAAAAGRAWPRNVRLRQAALGLTVFLVLTFMPVTDMFLFKHGLNPLNNPAGHASQTLQQKLEK